MADAYAQLVQFTKMLKNLNNWLDKGVEHAKAKGFDPELLLQFRLAPDMFPLVQQVQNSCDGVKFLAARLSGSEAPKHPDTEKTLPEIRERIQSVIKYVEGFKPEQFAGADARTIPLSFLPGKGTRGADWLHEMNVPNTYFHFVTAYAILRHNGVSVGKIDFIGGLNLFDV
jgi:hypothetical protein